MEKQGKSPNMETGTFSKNKWKVLGLLAAALIITIYGFYSYSTRYCQKEGELSKKAVAEIAIKEFVKQTNKNASEYTTRFDGGNKHWNKYYLQYYPFLKGKNYQAIRLIEKQKEWIRPLTPGGGPNWMCIDRKTGQALAIYAGI